MIPLLTIFVVALAAAAALTPLVRRSAFRRGLVAMPVKDRWHQRPVALLGGIAIVAAFLTGIATTGAAGTLWPLLLYCGGMFLLGAADDVWHMRPRAKLAGQVVLTALFLALIPRPDLTGFAALDLMLALLWLVGITNAFNLLDNIDGLCAGIALIAGVFYLSILAPAGSGPLVLALAAFAGAVAGFLIYNFQPASIFMGDGGSFFIGSFLAAASLLAVPGGHVPLGTIAAVPILILLTPIFDTTFVTLTRGLSGRSAFVGGRDHTSHRLVALGIGERRAVLALYALAATGGAVAVAVSHVGLTSAVALIGLYLTIVLAGGIVLGHVEAAQSRSHEPDDRDSTPLISEVTNRNRLYEMALDTALIAIAYYAAYQIRFHEPQFTAFLPPFLASFPLVVLCQIGALWVTGKYRQVWRDFGATELMRILQGIVLGLAASVILMVYLHRFEGFSRGVFVIDGVLLSFLLVGWRAGVSWVDDQLRRLRARGRRVLIYGAGRGGALLLREVLQNRELGLTPVAFVDDDPRKYRTRVDGVPVAGGLADVPALVARHEIDEILIGIRDLPPAQLSRLLEICRAQNLQIRRMRFALDEVDLSGRPTIRAFPHAG